MGGWVNEERVEIVQLINIYKMKTRIFHRWLFYKKDKWKQHLYRT